MAMNVREFEKYTALLVVQIVLIRLFSLQSVVGCNEV